MFPCFINPIAKESTDLPQFYEYLYLLISTSIEIEDLVLTVTSDPPELSVRSVMSASRSEILTYVIGSDQDYFVLGIFIIISLK